MEGMPEAIPAFGGFVVCLVWIVVLLLGVGSTAFWIWMLIDCATKEEEEGNTKVVWILIIVFTGIIGALIYLFVRKLPRGRAV